MPLILSLCDYTGNWSRPYREAGYDVHQVDLKHGNDIRLLEALSIDAVHGILAAPPCTEFASSGARWWKDKGEQALLAALSLVDACCRIVLVHQPAWWVIENPIGRLTRWLGEPVMRFDPCDFGDPYTKRTCLWGEFRPPVKRQVAPIEGSKIHLMPPSEDRAARRSETPMGFARAFFEANP